MKIKPEKIKILNVWKKQLISNQDIYAYYQNLYFEIENKDFTDIERITLYNPINYYGKFLRRENLQFFIRHFILNIHFAIENLFTQEKPVILDIGCGCGATSLLFSMLGARVIGIDSSEVAITICRKRKCWYEKVSRKKLDLEFVCETIDEQSIKKYSGITGVYSLFATGLINNHVRILKDMVQNNSNSIKSIIIQDTNEHYILFRIGVIKTTSKVNFRNLISAFPQKRYIIKGGFLFPPIFYKLFPNQLLIKIETLFSIFPQLFPSNIIVIKF